jgi:hypothetical protein
MHPHLKPLKLTKEQLESNFDNLFSRKITLREPLDESSLLSDLPDTEIVTLNSLHTLTTIQRTLFVLYLIVQTLAALTTLVSYIYTFTTK